MFLQTDLTIQTSGRGFTNVTASIMKMLAETPLVEGLCHIFVSHTSASLIISENFDPAVLTDLEGFIGRLVRDGDAAYTHVTEGSDDMAAHIRSVLTQTALTIPIKDSKLALGRWQAIYLWEHRFSPHKRKIIITFFN